MFWSLACVAATSTHHTCTPYSGDCHCYSHATSLFHAWCVCVHGTSPGPTGDSRLVSLASLATSYLQASLADLVGRYGLAAPMAHASCRCSALYWSAPPPFPPPPMVGPAACERESRSHNRNCGHRLPPHCPTGLFSRAQACGRGPGGQLCVPVIRNPAAGQGHTCSCSRCTVFARYGVASCFHGFALLPAGFLVVGGGWHAGSLPALMTS